MKQQTLDTVFRVIRLSRELKDAVRNRRAARKITNEQFVREAIETNLPELLTKLQRLGFGKPKGQTIPARLPFSNEAGTLKTLRDASASIGIAATRLLVICLAAATQKPVAKTRRGRPPKSDRGEKKSK